MLLLADETPVPTAPRCPPPPPSLVLPRRAAPRGGARAERCPPPPRALDGDRGTPSELREGSSGSRRLGGPCRDVALHVLCGTNSVDEKEFHFVHQTNGHRHKQYC